MYTLNSDRVAYHGRLPFACPGACDVRDAGGVVHRIGPSTSLARCSSTPARATLSRASCASSAAMGCSGRWRSRKGGRRDAFREWRDCHDQKVYP